MSVEWVFRAVLVFTWMIPKFLGCRLFPLKIAMHGLFQIYMPPTFRWPLWTWLPVFINAYRVSQPSSLKYDYITWDALGRLEDVVETAEATCVKDSTLSIFQNIWGSSSPAVLKLEASLERVSGLSVIVTLLTSYRVLLILFRDPSCQPTTLTRDH